jgi:hypothetical protein
LGLELSRQPIESLVDLVDVSVAWDAQASQRLLDRFVYDTFQVPPSTFHLIDKVGGDVERLAHVVQKSLASFLQRAAIDQVRWSALFFGENYLGQRDLSQVLACLAIHHLDLMSVAHKTSDALERDVAARSRVIELAIRVLLDNVSLGGTHSFAPILMRCVIDTLMIQGGW